MDKKNNDNSAGLLEAGFERLMIVVRWVDSWKKLAILMILIIFTVSTYIAWENRRALAFAAMGAFGTPQIDEMAVGPEITSLMADTGAIAASVWSLNLEKNQRRAIYVRERERDLQSLVGTGDLIFRPSSRLSDEFIHLIDNKTNCWEHIANTAVGKSARGAGVKWICAAAIPPEFGAMIGMLAVGFSERPENEDYVKLRIKQAAQRVIK
ncbi:hypothetical protein JBO41_21185 [Enterobacter asburiae]|jgi:hypothetical protein|uniref:hypothetical protein n=1 Tax=Enterobacter asburiae TaxID=61645 RepID=UPI00192B208E|nr:hypothetical protein [Enterobacter asburiae]MBL5914649.1 hypothetical protein [Enterobacter asburiae]MBL5919130.1 hypothetical protein [Enterobacter asburiae]